MEQSTRIAIIDDDRAVCVSLGLLLKKSGFAHNAYRHPDDFDDENLQRTDLVLLDMNFTVDTSGKKGIATLKLLKEKFPELPVILMTGWATIQLAVEGMKLGASDFVAKPWDNKQLISSIKTILQLKKVQSATQTVDSISDPFQRIIGESDQLMEMIQIARSVSQTNASVLILGESGTGKELVAEAIHYSSLRTANPFVKVNLGGISESLFESEMFGHKKGAFTGASKDRKGRFELASSGTIFLDEIGDLPMSGQVKLLRVLQDQKFEVLGSSIPMQVDVRVISATNKPLQQMVLQEQFREDLFYRINLISIVVPPLADRKSDIPLLVEHFRNNMSTLYQRPKLTVLPDAVEWLKNQNYPGNIRQLKNLVERTILVNHKNELSPDDFKAQARQIESQSNQVQLPEVGKVSLEEMEKRMIIKALNHHQYNISEAAKSLGISRNALYRRMFKYQL